jgi:hypothetical protein
VVLEQHVDGLWAGTCRRRAKPVQQAHAPSFE